MGSTVKRRLPTVPIAVRPIFPEDPVVGRALDGIRAGLTDTSVLDGIRLLDGVALVSGETKRVVHGLGRKLRGWIVVRTSEGAALGYLKDEQSAHSDTDTYLYLRPEGYSPTVSLLVF